MTREPRLLIGFTE